MTSNFLTPAVARAVAEAKQEPGALISAPRIYDNMLSSQPLTFNLFAELQQDLELAGVVGRSLWPDLVHSVESIRFEWSPGRADPRFLGNRSAFDVAWLCRDRSGEPTLVAIEVKYHEDMTQDPGAADKNTRYSAVAAASGVFHDPEDPALRALPLRQIWFDHLLALSMVGADRLAARSRFVLLAPAINAAVNAVDVRYRAQLRDALTYERRTMEEVAAVMSACTDADWVDAFQGRYLTPNTRRG